MSTLDVIVVGAGAAGLAAAEKLAESGKAVLVLEASERAGGRIFTDLSSGTAIELGAEFVHGKPRPTLTLAERAGVELIPIPARHFVKEGGRFVDPGTAFQPFADVLARVRTNDPDESARAFVARHGIEALEREQFRELVEGFEAAPLSQVSIQSLAADSSALADDDSQFRVRGGYRTLLEFLIERARTRGAELRFGARVTRIEYRPRGPVAVHLATQESPLTARLAVIAVPLPVLQGVSLDNRLTLEPAPPELGRALELLAMGQACRVSFRFRPTFAPKHLPAGATFLREPALAFETFWLQQEAREPIWTAWAGGPKAQLLASESREKRERIALSSLAKLLELDLDTVTRELVSVHHHDFSNDPLVQGAYSFIRPNGMTAARTLAEPIADALFIAGEATDHEFPGTVAGALSSGERAARQALDALAE